MIDRLLTSAAIATVAAAVGFPPAGADSRLVSTDQAQTAVHPCPDARDHTLPLPTAMTPNDFHDRLLAFLQATEYVTLGWCTDKGVRDTGPYVNGTYLGTHPAVRIYYSPAVMTWLTGGRTATLPDGAMIVKEMYSPGPAARYEGQTLTPASWTVMIKDSKGSNDGWFWGGLWSSNPPMPRPSDSFTPPFSVPNEGFGLSCLHCHASAENEATFASLNNIDGFPGNPISYFIDNTWRTPPPARSMMKLAPGHAQSPDSTETDIAWSPNTEVLKYFKGAITTATGDPQPMLPETYDHVVARPDRANDFVTSDQCMICHSGNAWMGSKFVMILEPRSSSPVNVSPYGEWRWSPMGLAGRDPIFYAQLESELRYLRDRPADAQTVINTCFRCHGVMGKRQLDIDHGWDSANPKPGGKEPDFDLAWLTAANPAAEGFRYGALARDGVSCAACHRIAATPTPPGQNPLQHFLEHSITGRFPIGPAGVIGGPFEDDTISTHPMKASLGLEPKYDAYIKDSRMCGSCHTIDLPVMDQKPFGHSLEQVTYLEWLNSEFQTDFTPGPNAKSCQACHMPGGYANHARGVNIAQIQTTFADVQDDTYPAAEHLAPMDQVRARFRETGFVRHQFQGLNVFLLEMFNRFMEPDTSTPPNWSNDILGVRKSDYMSTLDTGLPNAIENFVQTAGHETALVEVLEPQIAGQQLTATVRVSNKTGHRFPSGVGFRRAFIEFIVLDTGRLDPATGNAAVVWASGRTNAAGLIVDGQGNPLPTEYIGTAANRRGAYQPHFYGTTRPITSPTEVQIYEELIKDADGNFTTSFLRRDTTVKDNRLLPKGWTASGPDSASLNGEFLRSTFPEGDAARDPAYADGSGTHVVRYQIPLSALPAGIDSTRLRVKATLVYQSIPPYYLMQRFEQAPDGPATRRLFYLVSRLNTTGTPIAGWRLPVVSSGPVAPAVP
jgi:hypothetical protein